MLKDPVARGIAVFIGSILIVLIMYIGPRMTMYQVDEREYGLHMRFGEVRHIREEPGLYLKIPFVDKVQRIDRRTLRADIPPREVPDRDKERLVIDIIIRYEIVDPVAFRKTLRNEDTALERMKSIAYSSMRDTIGEHDRTEIIGAQPRLNEKGQIVNDDEGLPIYDSLVGTRDATSQAIQDRITQAVESQGYGIRIINAHIKRADFPQQIRQSIVEKLWSERQRVASRHRADGQEEYLKRTAQVQAEADILIAEAERDARVTRGEGEAKAISIIQEALDQDPQFYNYLRTLQSYETTIQPGST